MTTNKEIQEIIKDCLKGKTKPIQTIQTINDLIGGIQSVKYKSNKGFSIYSKDKAYSIQTVGYQKKEAKLLPEIAVMSYMIAKENGSRTPGEVHISRQASTKHHMYGIMEIVSKYTA